MAKKPKADDADAHLARLRTKYADAPAGQVTDPAFQEVVRLLFKGTNRRAKPYEGVSTFLDAPLRTDAPTLADWGKLDLALIGVPMDLGVTNRPGSRFGPRAVRAVERVGPYHEVHRIVPQAMVAMADVGDVPFRSRFSLEDAHADIEAFIASLTGAGVTPLSVGGDHSISLSILKGLATGRAKHAGKTVAPPGMVHIDAHCDTGGPFEGSRFHHGGPFREAVLAGVLDPRRTIQIGIRGMADYLWEFSTDSGMTVIHAHDFQRIGIDATLEKIRAVIGDGPVYVSFDIDSLDPAFAPGTGTPEIGGLTTREAMALLRGCAGLDVIGGDVVEVAPQYDATTNTAHAAAQMLFEITSLASLAIARRRA